MKLRWGIFLGTFGLAVASIFVRSQTTATALVTRDPELSLRILPTKETYLVGEKVFTKTEFTNLTDKTLCFPDPAQDCEHTVLGSIITSGEAVANNESEQFICHVDGRGTPREELLQEIEQRWIKIAPGAVHTTKTAQVAVNLDKPGQWRLKASYHPPEALFGNVAEYRAFRQSTAQSAGCAVPERYASAEPVIVNAIPPPDEK